MKKVIINCDMGEGVGNDELIIPFIHAANIACGYHAGDTNTMTDTIQCCLKHDVSIGAHISFFDRENFGRKEIQLSSTELYDLVRIQIHRFNEIAKQKGAKPTHLKPHGALYNRSARDATIAAVIANAVKDIDPSLVLYGLSGSHSISEAKKIGLVTASETFADRTYQDDGSLTPRSQPNALLEDVDEMIQQVLQMVKGTVTTINGKTIPILAETICIHGDGANAVEFAKAIHKELEKK